MPTINVGNLENQEKILDYLTRIYASSFDAAAVDWKALFESRRTGEVFSTKFYNLSTSNTAIGTRMNNSLNKTCTPSTDTVKGQDDFASFNAFWFIDCNFTIDSDGMKKVTAIDGQSTFSRTGAVDVGVLTPPLYYGIEKVSDGEIWHLSDSPHEELGLTLMPHCRGTAGQEMPYGIVTKYYAGLVSGVMYSSSELPVANFQSYQTLHSYMNAKGAGYVGSGSERSIFLKTMYRIKYANSSSQATFTGCTSYSAQCANTTAATGVKYVTLATANAAKFYVGGTVSIGECTNTSNLDRGNAYMRNIADKVKVTAIEAVDTSYSRVYVDVDSTFDTTTATYISTMPLHSGQTDDILGNDGYLANDGKHSFRIQGVEDGIGAYMVSGNEIIDKDTATVTNFYNRNGGSYTTDEATVKSDWKLVGSYESASSADFWIGQVEVDLETGSEVPSVAGSGDSVGTGDRFYFGGNSTGLREYLTRGHLGDGSFAGLSCVYSWYALSNASWDIAACV